MLKDRDSPATLAAQDVRREAPFLRRHRAEQALRRLAPGLLATSYWKLAGFAIAYWRHPDRF